MPPRTERRPFTIPDWLRPVVMLMHGGRRSAGRVPGAAVARAAARLAKHRKAFAHVDLTPIPSRQQRRAEERAAVKAQRSYWKAQAQGSRMGGAAACR